MQNLKRQCKNLNTRYDQCKATYAKNLNGEATSSASSSSMGTRYEIVGQGAQGRLRDSAIAVVRAPVVGKNNIDSLLVRAGAGYLLMLPPEEWQHTSVHSPRFLTTVSNSLTFLCYQYSQRVTSITCQVLSPLRIENLKKKTSPCASALSNLHHDMI